MTTEDVRKQEKDERRARVQRERQEAARRVLKTEDGKLMLQMLEAKYDRNLLGPTTDRTLANVGAREVVCHLRWLRDREE